MKSLTKQEWIKMRDELQAQYFDIYQKMELVKHQHQRDIYEEALRVVSEKLQRLDGLINPPDARLDNYHQLKEIY